LLPTSRGQKITTTVRFPIECDHCRDQFTDGGDGADRRPGSSAGEKNSHGASPPSGNDFARLPAAGDN